MKKIFFGVAVLAAMMATSCQNEELIVSQQQGNVVVNASTVNESRTYVEGKTVYWSEGDRILAYGEDVLGSLELVGTGGDVNGRFIGYVSGNVNDLEYLIYPADMASYKDGKVTIKIGSIDKKHSNAPMFAAYGSNVTFQQLSAMIRIQINNVPAKDNDLTVSGAGIGSAVFENGALTFNTTSSSIKVTGLEEGTNEICIPVFTSNSAAADVNLTFSLAGAEKTLTLPLAQKTLTANSVPVLTYDPVTNQLTEATDLPESDDPAEGYVITTLTELVQFANEVNGGNTYEGETVTLKNDIDLDNMPWTPIGDGRKITEETNAVFMGTFDGKDHIISNLTVATEGNAPAGLFGASQGTIKNLKINNVDIKGHYKAGAVVGDGLCAKIENCHVDGGTILSTPHNNDDGNQVGGIVGYLSAEPAAYVKDCSVNDLKITAYRDVAGIAGSACRKELDVTGCTVSNTTITADMTAEYKEKKDANAGTIVGRLLNKEVEITGNTVGEGVEVIVKANKTIDGLKTAVKEEGAKVYVEKDTYTFPSSSIAEGVTIICEEGTVFEGNSKLNIKGATVIGATFSNPSGSAVDQTINGTLKNCTFTGYNALRWTYAGETVVFEDCIFDGDLYGIHFDGGANDVIFRNCTISGFNGLGSALTMVTFEGCTFKGNGKSGYNGANLWGSAKMINCEFTFDGSTATEWIDCIGADKTYEFTNCTVNGVDYTEHNYTNYGDIFSRNNAIVKINGVDCQL